jgi:hypothetical protein
MGTERNSVGNRNSTDFNASSTACANSGGDCKSIVESLFLHSAPREKRITAARAIMFSHYFYACQNVMIFFMGVITHCADGERERKRAPSSRERSPGRQPRGAKAGTWHRHCFYCCGRRALSVLLIQKPMRMLLSVCICCYYYFFSLTSSPIIINSINAGSVCVSTYLLLFLF